MTKVKYIKRQTTKVTKPRSKHNKTQPYVQDGTDQFCKDTCNVYLLTLQVFHVALF